MRRSRVEQVAAGSRQLLALDRAVVRVALAPTLQLVAGVSDVDLVQVSLFDRTTQHVVCHTGEPSSVPAELPRRSTACEVVTAAGGRPSRRRRGGAGPAATCGSA